MNSSTRDRDDRRIVGDCYIVTVNTTERCTDCSCSIPDVSFVSTGKTGTSSSAFVTADTITYGSAPGNCSVGRSCLTIRVTVGIRTITVTSLWGRGTIVCGTGTPTCNYIDVDVLFDKFLNIHQFELENLLLFYFE